MSRDHFVVVLVFLVVLCSFISGYGAGRWEVGMDCLVNKVFRFKGVVFDCQPRPAQVKPQVKA